MEARVKSSHVIKTEFLSVLILKTASWFKQDWGFPVAQMVKSLPAVQETRIRSLDLEDLQEKETATHSSILVWKIPWMEEPGQLQSMGLQRVRHD